MSMTKAEFFEHMDRLWDGGGRFTIQIHTKHYMPRRKGEPSEDTQALADRFKKMIADSEDPFDKAVVATKEILALSEFRDSTATRVGRALSLIGAVKGGQVLDGYHYKTSVWIVYDHDRLVGGPRSRLEYIYQRRTD